MKNILTNIKNLIPAIYSDDPAKSEALRPVMNALQWVIGAMTAVGALLITISLIRTGIKMANADSPEEQQKCKKRILYSILGLVLIISAGTAVTIIMGFVPEWLEANA